jgi:hypothetical protein
VSSTPTVPRAKRQTSGSKTVADAVQAAIKKK